MWLSYQRWVLMNALTARLNPICLPITPAGFLRARPLAYLRQLLMPDDAWLPFSQWNLRYNPFGELTAAERAHVAVFDPDPFLEMLKHDRAAVQFIGDCGRGKTTRLLSIRHRFGSAAAFIYLPALATVTPRWWQQLWRLHGELLIIDEAQRIPWPLRTRIFRRGLPLALGTHRDLRRPLERAGYRVITVPVGPGNNAEHVRQFANARLAAARLAPGAVPQLSAAEAQQLSSRFGDDLRAIEQFLYHQVQHQAGGNGQMRFID